MKDDQNNGRGESRGRKTLKESDEIVWVRDDEDLNPGW